MINGYWRYKMNKVLFSSKTDEWSTPQDLYDELNKEFNFTLDPCATNENHKCEKYYTLVDNGLLKDWSRETVFMNPPYGREITQWIAKAYHTSLEGATIVCLLPARTNTNWFHAFIINKAKEIRFLKGKIKFGNSKTGAPFPSMIVVFKY
jgi:site-specific DNA-methyltransferase (adenine-specific)